MLLLEVAIAGGVVYAGARAYYLRTRRPSLGALLTASPPGPPAPEASTQLQRASGVPRAESGRLALVGLKAPAPPQDARGQLLADLTGAVLEPSERERTVTRHLSVSLAAVAISGAAAVVHSPLIVLSVPLLGYLYIPLLRNAYRAFQEKRQRRLQFYEVLVFGGELASGYLFAAALSTALYFMAERALIKAEARSRDSLINVFGRQPRVVWVLVDGAECELPFEAVRAGDLLVVSAGEMIPADGRVTQGSALVDQHVLTGEAQPVEKASGDQVLAATVVLSGKIVVEVQRAGDETTAAQIATILNRTAQLAGKIELRGTALLERSIPLTLGLGALSLPLVGGNGALAVLESSFGYNLRLSGPLSLLNLLQKAAHQGVLVKDGEALELLPAIDTLVFDKTGTLTLEQPHVGAIHTFHGATASAVLAWAAAAEQRQEHPIARAIVRAAREWGLTLPEVDHAHLQLGYGITVNLEGHTLRVGSERFLTQEHVNLPETLDAIRTACHGQGSSLVLVARDQELVGALELNPTLRPEAAAVVRQLKQRELKIYLLSGDHEQPTRQMARRLGIEHYVAEVLPQDKSALVERLQREGRKVCFVGDGINDAIALRQADLSVSLRGASTAATDTAQVVLMDTSLQRIVDLLDLGREYHETMRANLLFATVPSVICIGGVFLLHWGLGAALVLYNLSLAGSVGSAYLPLLSHQLQGQGQQGAAASSAADEASAP